MAHRFPAKTGTTRKGGRYDVHHQRARKAAAARHDPSDPCTRCGQPLGPMGSWLHYDHTDDGTAYLGFAHATCNKRAGAQRGAAIVNGTTAPRRHTRKW
jgi:hypothetical protein